MSGSAVKSHDKPKMKKYYLQYRQFCTSCRSRVYPPILEAVRLLQRYHKNRWDQRHPLSLETDQHRVHLQIQCESLVTNWLPGDWGRSP